MVTVSSKVVPLIHIDAVPFVGHDLHKTTEMEMEMVMAVLSDHFGGTVRLRRPGVLLYKPIRWDNDTIF